MGDLFPTEPGFPNAICHISDGVFKTGLERAKSRCSLAPSAFASLPNIHQVVLPVFKNTKNTKPRPKPLNTYLVLLAVVVLLIVIDSICTRQDAARKVSLKTHG